MYYLFLSMYPINISSCSHVLSPVYKLSFWVYSLCTFMHYHSCIESITSLASLLLCQHPFFWSSRTGANTSIGLLHSLYCPVLQFISLLDCTSTALPGHVFIVTNHYQHSLPTTTLHLIWRCIPITGYILLDNLSSCLPIRTFNSFSAASSSSSIRTIGLPLDSPE